MVEGSGGVLTRISCEEMKRRIGREKSYQAGRRRERNFERRGIGG